MARWLWIPLVGAVAESMLTACGAGTSHADVEIQSAENHPREPWGETSEFALPSHN